MQLFVDLAITEFLPEQLKKKQNKQKKKKVKECIQDNIEKNQGT